MKQKLYIIVILSGLFLTAAPGGRAAPQQIGTSGVYWELVGNRLTITGAGDIPDYAITSPPPPWNADIANIHTVDIQDGVTAIGQRAFNGCTSLVSVDIPESVTKIGDYAFGDCTGLNGITFHWPDPSAVTIAGNVFGRMPLSRVTLYVPLGAEALYRRYFAAFSGMNIEAAYAITAFAYANGAVTASPAFAPAGAQVTLTLEPSSRYEPDEVLAFETGDWSASVALSGMGLARTFVMPAHDVTAEVAFRPTRFAVPSDITSTLLLPDATAGGVPVEYALDPRSVAYARLDGNLLIPLRDGEIRITASGGASLPTTAYILYISLPPPASAIRRMVALPAVSGAVSDPPAGRHSVVSGEDFVFTLTPAPGNLAFPAAPVVSTGRTAEPDGIVSDNGDGSYTVRVPSIRQTVTLRIAIDLPTALVDTDADRVLSAGNQLRITASAPGEAHVYTLAGARIKTLRYPAGETVATLPAGHYVVVAGGKAYRIIIR